MGVAESVDPTKAAASLILALARMLGRPVKELWAQRCAAERGTRPTDILTEDVNNVIDALAGSGAETLWSSLKAKVKGALIRPEYLEGPAYKAWLNDPESRAAFVTLVGVMLLGRQDAESKVVAKLQATYSKHTLEVGTIANGRIETVCAIIVAGILANVTAGEKAILVFSRAAHAEVVDSIQCLPQQLVDALRSAISEEKKSAIRAHNEDVLNALWRRFPPTAGHSHFDIRASLLAKDADVYGIYAGDRFEDYDAEKLDAATLLNVVCLRKYIGEDGIFVLQAPGGSGKSSYLQALAYAGAAMEMAIFFIDINKIRDNLKKFDEKLGTGNVLDINIEMLFDGSLRGGKDMLGGFSGSYALLLVDGLNEAPSLNTRQALLACLLRVRRSSPNLTIVASDRLSDALSGDVWRLALAPLSISEIRLYANGGKEVESSNALHLLSTPFFLDKLVVSSPNQAFDAEAKLSRPAVFESFFRRALSEEPKGLPWDSAMRWLSQVAFEMYQQFKGQIFPSASWVNRGTELAGEAPWNGLTAALKSFSMLIPLDDETNFRFQHQLLHDYLVARYLAEDSGHWTPESLNAATWHALNQEVVDLAVEIIASKGSSDSFLNKVYDWNYPAVIGAIRGLEGARRDGTAPRPIGESFRDAIAALIAHKARDPFASTASGSKKELSYFKHGLPVELHALANADESDELKFLESVAALVRERFKPEASEGIDFELWKTLFCSDAEFQPGDFRHILADSPLIGWTAANVLKRQIKRDPTPSREIFGLLRAAFWAAAGPAEYCVVRRRRLVYVCGSIVEDGAVEFLADCAFAEKESINVREDALRSMLEVGMTSPGALSKVSHLMMKNVYHFGEPLIRRFERSAKVVPSARIPENWTQELTCVFDAGRNLDATKVLWDKAFENFNKQG